MSFDERCHELAETFLADSDPLPICTERNCGKLAQEIQDVIEAFIASAKDNYEPPDPPGWEGGFAENH